MPELLLLTLVGSGFHFCRMINSKHHCLTLGLLTCTAQLVVLLSPAGRFLQLWAGVCSDSRHWSAAHAQKHSCPHQHLTNSKLVPQNWQHKETAQGGLDGKYLLTVNLDCDSVNSAARLNTVDSESWRQIFGGIHFFYPPMLFPKSKYLGESWEN